MSPSELKRLRAKLECTQQELAQRVGVTRNTINRWEMGIRTIPEPAARLMIALAEDHIDRRDLNRIRREVDLPWEEVKARLKLAERQPTRKTRAAMPRRQAKAR